jgi:hypothetical protein
LQVLAASASLPDHVGLIIALSLSMLTVGCWSFSKWSRTDDFVSRLRCKMSEQEIESTVRLFKNLELRKIQYEPRWTLVATEGTTAITLALDQTGLRRIQVSWIDAIEHRRFLPEKDLCNDPNH